MSDNQSDKSPSADEIVDSVAADMGVQDKKVPENEGDALDGLGGIFGVQAGSKSKKRKGKSKKELLKEKFQEKQATSDATAERTETAEKLAQAEAKATEPTREKKKAHGGMGGVDGVFNPGGDDGGPVDAEPYLGEDDLDGYQPKKGIPTSTIVMGVIVVVLLGALGAVVFSYTDMGGDLAALFQGNLKERRLAEKERIEEEHRQKQLAALEKFGTLQITGYPLYALIKLDGQTQYGQTSSGAWRELRLTPGVAFQNLKIKEPHTVEVTAPGFKPESFELTEGMWENTGSVVDYAKTLNVNLLPESGKKGLEFEQRMQTSGEIAEKDYWGDVTINTIPSGARVVFDGDPLLDKNGEEMLTPVTFSSYWEKDEETGKLEEVQVNIDTPPDRGHKIELMMPEDKGEFPQYVTALQRRMWDCQWKDGEEPENGPYPEHCNYKFVLDFDFNGLKNYIKRREAEIERVKKRNAEMRAEQEAEAKAEAEAQAAEEAEVIGEVK